MLEDGIRWAAALAPPVTYLRAAYLRDEVAHNLSTTVDPIVAEGTTSKKTLSPEDCVAVFNDAVMRVRHAIVSAAGGGGGGLGGGRGGGGDDVRAALPFEFIAAGAGAAPGAVVGGTTSAGVDQRVDVLLTILDGAMLPPFPPPIPPSNTNPTADAATTRLQSYMLDLETSLAPGAVAASFAKVGYADGGGTYSSHLTLPTASEASPHLCRRHLSPPMF